MLAHLKRLFVISRNMASYCWLASFPTWRHADAHVADEGEKPREARYRAPDDAVRIPWKIGRCLNTLKNRLLNLERWWSIFPSAGIVISTCISGKYFKKSWKKPKRFKRSPTPLVLNKKVLKFTSSASPWFSTNWSLEGEEEILRGIGPCLIGPTDLSLFLFGFADISFTLERYKF